MPKKRRPQKSSDASRKAIVPIDAVDEDIANMCISESAEETVEEFVPPTSNPSIPRQIEIPVTPATQTREQKQLPASSEQTPSEKTQTIRDAVPKHTKNVEETIIEGQKLIKRPGYGNKGSPIQLVANFFPVTLKEGLIVYHYDLAVKRKQASKKKPGKSDPETESHYQDVSRLPRFLAVQLMNNLFANNKGVFHNRHGLAFDGQKNLLSTYEFKGVTKNEPKEFTVPVKNEDKNIDEEFLVVIQFAARIAVDMKQVFNRSLQERNSLATLVYDIVLKQTYFFNSDYLPQGRRIFYYPDPLEKFPLGNGIYRYPGFWQSLRPVHGWKIMINVDQANTSFVKSGTVLDLMRELNNPRTRAKYNPSDIDERDLRDLKRQLEKVVKGLKITQTQRTPHRTAKCTRMTSLPAAKEMFNEDNQTKISVADYFNKKFKAREFVANVRYPKLPCLCLGNKNLIPLEFCSIKAGQRYPKKLDGQQTSNMLRVASQPAEQRRNLINEDMSFLKMDKDPYLKNFGITVSNEMVKLNGRVLPPCDVELGRNNILQPRLGAWNMRDAKLISGCRIRKFGVLSTTNYCDENTKRNFLANWVGNAKGMGISVESMVPSWSHTENAADKMTSCLEKAKREIKELDLVFVILDGQNTDYYAHVKQAGDVVTGINTQCVQLKNVRDAKPSTLSNINLKINGKLGGINSKLPEKNMSSIKDFLREPILYLGADVNHASPDEDCEPISCAAIVGNVDVNPSVYSARIFLQSQERNVDGTLTRRPQEWISEMKTGVQMTIEQFLRRNKVLPRRIIMYRDGVGETMFGLVMNKEMPRIREACLAVSQRYPDMVRKSGFKNAYEPTITFIVVQKRHHTRLFCANQRDAVGRGSNVPPGTTVDTSIVHPEEFDFYLCSHLGLQGTSKPTHYHVLWDENRFSADELQLLTYYLCYTYCRSTCSVSIPPPCYYADLVAYRARKYLEVMNSDNSSVASSSATGKQSLDLARLQKIVNVNDAIVEKGMYFV